MSLEPFGHAPSGSSNPDYMYLVGTATKSTRLQSIGANVNSSNYPYNISSGYVSLSGSSCYFGYAIKGDDILVFSSFKTSGAANPWNSITNTHVSIISLNAFSEFYCPNDTYGLLNYEVKNYGTGSNTEVNASYTYGAKNQTLNYNGDQICYNSYQTSRALLPVIEVKTYYDPSGTNTVPFCGVPFVLSTSYGDAYILGGNQQVKGSTKPELLCANVSKTSLSLNCFSTVLNGSLMHLYSHSASSDGCGCIPPIGEWSSISLSSIFTGYYNTYIGWDSENPDISTDASWTTYTPDVSPLI
jgi:hypothetical protein